MYLFKLDHMYNLRNDKCILHSAVLGQISPDPTRSGFFFTSGCFSFFFSGFVLNIRRKLPALPISGKVASLTEYCSDLYNHITKGYPGVLKHPPVTNTGNYPILWEEVEAAVKSLKPGNKHWSRQHPN